MLDKRRVALHLAHRTLSGNGSRKGQAIAVEITCPDVVTLDHLNGLLAGLGQAPLAAQEVRPLRAA